jgi:predicted TIM-barrel fold metal-dependent hydrolase
MPVFDLHSYFGGSIVPGVANSAGTITSTMQARGIDGALVFSAHARNVDPLSGNRVLSRVLEQSPALHGCLVTHVNRVDASVAAMREMMSSKRFAGMAITSMGEDEPIEKLVADDIINAYRRYGKPLFLHTHNAAMTTAALEIAKAYSMIKVVFIGMGGHDWRTACAAAHSTTNIYLETSGPLDRAKIPAAFEAVGAHRIVFGSGTPHVDAAAAMGLIEDSPLSTDVRRRICFDNSQRLLGFDSQL